MKQFASVFFSVFYVLFVLIPCIQAAYGTGDYVEDLCLPDAYGNTVCFSDYPNHVIILNWWRDG